ncbi:MAG: DUF502 domain-containing protein [Proteobacteria bacterium]|nr:DUF502 domain-containing protein [Pseudomonadota bacterium]
MAHFRARAFRQTNRESQQVKRLFNFVFGSLLAGVLILAPVYLAILLLLKAAGSLIRLVKPVAELLPDRVAREDALALILVLLLCFLAGLTVRTRWGRAMWERSESVLQKIPGYSIFRGFMQRLAGDSREDSWKPALAEIEEALVPAFIIEALADGRFTVFVPAVPAPFTGALYILDAARVHPVDVPFTHAIRAVSRWGSGCKDLVAAMERREISPQKAA